MLKRIQSIILVCVLLGTLVLPGCTNSQPGITDSDLINAASRSLSEYEMYIKDKKTAPKEAVIEIDGASFSSCQDYEVQIVELDGVSAAATGNEGSITYTFQVEESGLYDLDIDYYPLEGFGDTIERALYLDGKIPYSEARSLLLQRKFVDEGEKRYSTSGNEYRRSQSEVVGWYTAAARSGYGFIDAPLKLYLEAGQHTITLESIAEPVAIGALRLFVRDEVPAYEQVLKQYQTLGLKQADKSNAFEAEDASAKSDSTLYAVEDRSSCVTTPYESTLILLNCIGSNNWKHRGQWIEWTVTVPEEGLYTLSFRVKQDYVSGASATRRLYINGRIPVRRPKI